METKLKSLLNEIGVASEDIPKYVSNDDGAIQKYYMALLEKWYLEYPGMGKASLPEAIAQSCRYIEANYKSNLSLTEMANLTNFSISHFSALFKNIQATHSSVMSIDCVWMRPKGAENYLVRCIRDCGNRRVHLFAIFHTSIQSAYRSCSPRIQKEDGLMKWRNWHHRFSFQTKILGLVLSVSFISISLMAVFTSYYYTESAKMIFI